jgi:hypothetical protein
MARNSVVGRKMDFADRSLVSTCEQWFHTPVTRRVINAHSRVDHGISRRGDEEERSHESNHRKNPSVGKSQGD